MAELNLAYQVQCRSTGARGRAICSARTHHFVADDAHGEEIGAGELFFSGIAACAVNMVERIATADEIPLEWMEVKIESYHQDPGAPKAEVTIYDAIRVDFEMWGVSDDNAKKLVKIWKQR